MTHSVTAVIGPLPVLVQFASDEQIAGPKETSLGLGILGLPDHSIDKILGNADEKSASGFTYLFPTLRTKLQMASMNSWLVYVETEYFGGCGGQSAIAMKGGITTYIGEYANIGPINSAISEVGIHTLAPAIDGFETVGLHLGRYTEDFTNSAGTHETDA